MRPLRLLYYVSGHGFGHARRSMEVIAAVLARSPDAVVTVRTCAPPALFAPLPPSSVERSVIDVGMAERDTLTIDAKGTLDRLVKLCDDADRLVAEEIAAVRRVSPDVMLADVPFLAGDVAAAAGVPCYAASNFTWDWICDPLLDEEPAYAAVRERMLRGYGQMTACLRLPLGGVSEAFGRVIPTPLIAGRSHHDPEETCRAIGISATDSRPRVLIALRGGVPDATLRAAADEASDYLFLVPAAGSIADPSRNLRAVPPGAPVNFADLLAASDVVLSKLGYGIVSDCIAAGKRLLWPRRTGFREDEVVEREGPRYLRMRELPWVDFPTRWWRARLDEIMAAASPDEHLPTDGASRIARHVTA